MSLRDEAIQLAQRSRSCPLLRAAERLAPEEREAAMEEIMECIHDREISPLALSKALEKRGFELHEHVIRRHRQGQCKVCNGS